MFSLKHYRNNMGMTIVELLIALVIGLVTLTAVLNIFVYQNKTNKAQQEVAYAQQNVRAAMDLMTRDIRGAGYDPTSAGVISGVAAAGSNFIQLQADLNGDGDVNDPEAGDADYVSAPIAPDLTDPQEDITYALNGTTLQRGQRIANPSGFTSAVPAPWTDQEVILAEDVTSFQLSYVLWDGSTETTVTAPTAAQLSQIRTVVISLGVRTENTDSDTGQFRTRNLVSRVRIRNMGFQDIE